jgi:hypothetical protein
MKACSHSYADESFFYVIGNCDFLLHKKAPQGCARTGKGNCCFAALSGAQSLQADFDF